jgi:hypothetical protein
MNIAALATNINPISQLSNISSIAKLPSSDQGGGSSPPPISGKMMQSIMKSLSSMSSKPSSTSGSNANIGESIHSFVDALLNAMQSQQGGTESSSAAPVLPSNSRHHQGGVSGIEAGLQNLLDAIGSNDSGQTQASPSLKNLEQNANNVFSSLGIPTGDQSLTQLINNVKQSLTGTSPVGNLLSTAA